MKPKFRHILLATLALLMIAFMQPLITFIGGLALLLGVGLLIFRDLPANLQDALEQRLLHGLRRARASRVEPTNHGTATLLTGAPPTLNPAKTGNRRIRRRVVPVESDTAPDL